MPESRDLDVVQRWFQAVITHPDGVSGGATSAAAREWIPDAAGRIENVVTPSARLDAASRLSVYANAYYARLLECLADSFPMLQRALGEETFRAFAFGYLQRYPSRSYTLDRLGDRFADYLRETRSEAGEGLAEVDWPDFLIDLAELEWSIAQVFDGPGPERQGTLQPEELAEVPTERWAEARLEPVACLRLHVFRYPVNAYYTAVRAAGPDETVAPPGPAPEFLALSRRNYVVRRLTLEPAQHALLEALRSGARVGQAIACAAEKTDVADERLASQLHGWFRCWASEGLFAAVHG